MAAGLPGRPWRSALVAVGTILLGLALLFRGIPSGPDRGMGPPPPLPGAGPDLAPAGPPALRRPPTSAPTRAEAPAPAPEPPVPRGVVAGLVLDAEDRPAVRTLVWVSGGAEDDTPTCMTTGEGRYELKVIPGDHGILARGEGTGTAKGAVSLPTAGTRVEAATLRLPAGSVIRGRVVDRTGKPRPGVEVRCWSEDDATDPLGETRMNGCRFLLGGDAVETDPEGRFVLRGLAGGEATYRVFPDLRMTPQLRSDPPQVKGVKAEGDPLEFRVAGTAILRGVVVDSATGEPVPAFTVSRDEFAPPDGRFEAELGEERTVEVTARGYRGVWIPACDPPGESGERRIALEPLEESGTLTLLVTGEGGEPVAGLHAVGDLGSFPVWERSWAGSAVEFRVGRTEAGQQTVRIFADGWARATLAVSIPKGGEARPEVKLRRSGSARVRILDSKGSVLHFPDEVAVMDSAGIGPPVRWVFANPQGAIHVSTDWGWDDERGGRRLHLAECDGRLVGFLPGTYRLRVRDKGALKEVVFSIAAGEEVEVTVRLGE